MVNDHELLARLQQVFEAGELAEISARLLRVPEAWVGIHDERLLDRALSADRGPALGVGRLALLSLGFDAMPEERLSDTLEEKAASVWNAAARSDTSPTDLPGVGLLAIGLRRVVASEGAPHAASLILHAPAVWRSAVACAWPDLPEASVLLRTLLASDDPEALGVASHALLANLSVEDAAAALQQAWGERVPGEALARLISIEPEMARALATSIEIGDPTEGPSEHSVEDRSDEHLTRAAVFMARGAAPDAALALEAAWEAARGRTADIADAMADLAEMESNPVLAIEAERQSVHFGPSPARRARLALALANAGRPEEALRALPSSRRSPEEHVAAAASARQMGDTRTVEASLREAADQFRAMTAPPPAWLTRLAAELEQAGLSGLALQVLQRIIQSRPAEPLGRAHFAQALLQAGEASQGASEAAAALMIRPDLLPARRTLAACLQESGRPDAALEHWVQVAEHDPESLIDLGHCALAAQRLEIAEKASSQLLARDPGSTAAQILKGEILSQKGDAEGARACLEEATRANPSRAEAWIALAAAQSKCGDAFAGGATLTHAAQLMPQEPRLFAALAAHLDSQGQTRQALEAIERALQGLPGRAEWLALQGELLVRLGHTERAQTVLREALARRPGDSSARLSLAKLLEDSGQSAEAAELAAGLGEGLSPTAYLAAAKIVIRSAEETPDSAKLETAGRYLHEIEGAEGMEAQLALWSGRLHEAAGRHAEAFECFRLAEQQISPEAIEDHRAVVIGLARSALATGQAPLALATLEAALDRHPTSAELHIAFSEAALQADLSERALQAARQGAELAPHSVPALAQLARAARQIGDWKTAVDALRDLFGLAPRDPAAGFDLVEAALRAEDLPTARATLASLLWNHRTNPEVLRRAAQALFAAADAGAARAALRRAASLLPPASPAWKALARTSEEVGDLETAQSAWRKCTEIDPKDVEALAHSAGALWKLGRHAASIGLWQRCVALEPKNSDLQRDLARAYMANGETSRGLNAYGLAIQASPADVSLAHEAGTAALRFGALDEARDTLRHAARLAPHDPEIATALAQALYRLGRPQESLAAIQAVGRHEDLPPAAYAVHSLSAAAVGEGAAARASLDRVLHRPVRGVDDAAWVSRAAAKLGEWDEAVAAFDRVPVGENAQTSPAVRLARIGAILRSLEARLLLSLADVRRHLPNGSQGDQAASDLTALRGSAHGTTPEVEALNLRLGAAMGSLSDEGIRALEALVEKSADPGVGLSLAAAYLAKSQHARAHEVLDSLTHSGSDGSIPMLRGICLAARGDHETARKAYEQAAADPAFAPASIRLAAESWLAQARPEQAIAALNAALAFWPDEPLWHSRLASLYQEADNPAAALPHLQQAVELDPTDGPAGLALGRALRADGQISEAREVYARVLDRFPADGAVWKEAGDLALALGEAEVAAGWLERACTLAPSDANVLLSSARAAMALGKGREAADRARSAARLAPEDPFILLGLGEILAGQGKLDRALEAYDRALAHAEHPLPVQLARCRLLSRLGKSTEAATALEELSGADPENEQIWGALAEARESAGDEEAAIEAATRATRFAPRNPAHHLALARLSRKTGQLDRALDEVHQAQVLDPTEPAIFLELGAIYEGRREANEALQSYQRAIALNQRSPEAHFRAGVILKGLKSYTQAARMFRRAVDLDPKDAAAAHQLAAVRALELVHGGNLHSAVHP
jgi:tetratricopeptide (TPR) repeat protein